MPVDARFDASIWRADRRDWAPAWAHSLVLRVARREGFSAPRLRFVPPTFVEQVFRLGGGRYYPSQNAIAVVDTGRESRDKAIVCHELAHAQVCSLGDCGGQHDGRFFRAAESIYRIEGVSIAMARSTEDQGFPHAWNRAVW